MAVIVGCGGGSDAGTAATKSAAPPAIATTAGEAGTTDVTLDVNGHKIYMECRGSGAPTIVYLHGADGQSRSAAQIPEALGDRHRYCAYDRPNGEGSATPSTAR
jgi:hypothetical protein